MQPIPSKKSSKAAPEKNSKAIASLAYQIYEEEGKPKGAAKNHWVHAKKIIQNRISSPSKFVKGSKSA